MNFKELESPAKLRGGYYTPESVARFLTRWVLGKHPSSILEPSCGDGAFLKAVFASHDYRLRLTGIELLPSEAEKARAVARGRGKVKSQIITADFLKWSLEKIKSGETFDAVIGNPPYIRYQYLNEQDQALAEAVFTKHGLAFTKHTNAWVPFVIASLALLAPGGRLAMVIPSEILHVLHAGSLRKHLLSECRRIVMIDPSELLFEEALQGTILLMAEKKRSAGERSAGVAVVPMADNRFLRSPPEPIFSKAVCVSGETLNGKWMKILLSADELRVFEKVCRMPTILRFDDVASVDVGIVTGANNFFLVSDATVSEFGLKKFAKPMFGRSEHCPGVVYSHKLHKANAARGLPTNFIDFDATPVSRLPSGARRYIRLGEHRGLPKRYKCRIREPWYSVPSVYATSIGMLKRSHNFPRLILNSARAYTTDTAYRIRTKLRSVSPEALVYSFVNSFTALTAELEGRHYGGGVLELVPSEIEKLSVPVTGSRHVPLTELDQRVQECSDADELLLKQDAIVLKSAGLTNRERAIVHSAWRRIRLRRHRLVVEEQE